MTTGTGRSTHGGGLSKLSRQLLPREITEPLKRSTWCEQLPLKTMDMIIDQQVALDEALVPHASRLRIGKSNFRLRSDITSKESTLQLVYDVLRLTPFYKAFLVTTDVPEIYMQEFWATSTVHHHSIRFKMNNKKRIVNLEYFMEMLHLCPRLPNQTFDELPFEEEILAFVRYLGHSGKIRKLTDVNINKLHQPWRSFAAVINKCLSRKSTGYDSLRNSKAYKEYYAIASGAAPPKTKASVRKSKSSFDTTIIPPTTAGTRLFTSAKGKQPAKSSKAKGVLDVPTNESDEELSWKSSDEDDDDDDEVDERSEDQEDEVDQDDDDQDDEDQDDNDGDQDTDNDGNDDASLGMNVGGEKGQDAEDDDEELYRDVNIYLEGRDVQMIYVHTTQEFKDTHVTLTPVNPDGQQQSSSVSSQLVTSMLNPSPDAGIDSLFESTPRVNVQASTTVAPLTLTAPTLPPQTIPTISQVPQAPTPPATAPSTFLQDLLNFSSLFGFDHRLKTLEANFSKFVQKNKFAGAVSSILEIFERYMDQRMDEAIKIIKEQVKEQLKTSYDVAADLSEMELKKILIEKMESNKSILRSNEQRNLYKALVDAYECDKIIFDTYGDTVTLKIRRDDADKDDEPSAGSDQGSKRRREGKEPESTSAPKEKVTKTTGKSTEGSKSHQKTASKSAPVEEPIQTTQDLEEPSHQEFETVTLTPKLLVGPTYELMKGSCKSLVELKLFLEKVYKATIDQLVWNNPEGQQYPHNLLKPLPLIPDSRGCRVIPFDHFINNDLEYLRGGTFSHKYTTSVTKTKAANYGNIKWIEDLVPHIMWSQEPVSYDKYALWGISHWGHKHQQFYRFVVNRESARDVYLKRRIIAVTEIQIVEWHTYKHLDWITVRKLINFTVEECFAFNVSLRMFTRSIVIQWRVEDLQLGVESYQKKLNLTKPDTYRSDLKRREAYIAYSNPRGFIYQNKDKQNRLMRIDELHKFSDGTLNDVRTTLDDRLKARTKGSTQGYPLVSVEVLRYDKRSKSKNIGIVPAEMELILEQTQQGIGHEVSYRFIMDDPNITMAEYILLEEEKARRKGQTFDWKTTTHSRMEYFKDEDDSFTNLQTEYQL
nr:hypothetical protein [Tanacetum cinerariifolium]